MIINALGACVCGDEKQIRLMTGEIWGNLADGRSRIGSATLLAASGRWWANLKLATTMRREAKPDSRLAEIPGVETGITNHVWNVKKLLC
jgi:hypothetical protein